MPKGWGPSAKGVKSIAKEDPDAFKRKHDFDGRDFGDRGKNNDRDNDRNNDKEQASKDFDRDNRDKDTKKGFGSQGAATIKASKAIGTRARNKDQAKGDGSRPPPKATPAGLKDGTPAGTGATHKGGATDGSRVIATTVGRTATRTSRRTLVRLADPEAPISSSRATAIISIKVAAARARRRRTSASQVDLVAQPIQTRQPRAG